MLMNLAVCKTLGSLTRVKVTQLLREQLMAPFKKTRLHTAP